MKRPRLYLAGPEVFRPDARAEGRRLKDAAERIGADGIYPLDGDELHGPYDIKQRCREMIDAADAVVANISPFRGHHMDPGTAYEIGYAEASGKMVHLWSAAPGAMLARVPATPAGTGALVEWRDEQGHLVEDFELAENLMITAGNGQVWASPEEAMQAAVDAWRVDAETRSQRRHIGFRFVLFAAAMLGIVAAVAAIAAARAGVFIIDGGRLG